jgi:hypothetical protein
MASNRRMSLPAPLALSGKVLNNPVQLLHQPDMYEDAEVEPYSRRRNGTRILVVSQRVTPPSDIDGVLHVPGGEMPSSPTPFGDRRRRARWIKRSVSAFPVIMGEAYGSIMKAQFLEEVARNVSSVWGSSMCRR